MAKRHDPHLGNFEKTSKMYLQSVRPDLRYYCSNFPTDYDLQKFNPPPNSH